MMDADDVVIGMGERTGGEGPPLTPMPASKKWERGSIGYLGDAPLVPSAEEQLGDIRAALYRKNWMGPEECARPVAEVAIRAILEKPAPRVDHP